MRLKPSESVRWAIVAPRTFHALEATVSCTLRVPMVPTGQVAEAVCAWQPGAAGETCDRTRELLLAQRQKLVNRVARQLGRRVTVRDVWL